MSSVVVEAAAMSDIGLVRRVNQDTFAGDEGLGLFVVCDGMGGPAGGEVASALAAETFVSIFRQELSSVPGSSITATELAMERAAAAANRAVVARAGYDTRYRGMGTTLVAARLTGEQLTILNVGDSRAYLLQKGHLRQVSVDHSYLREQVELGLLTQEQASLSPLQSVITRAIGAETDVHPDLFAETVHPGDILLLASDGLTRELDDESIARILRHAKGPQHACEQLIEQAKESGGADNITCYIIQVRETSASS